MAQDAVGQLDSPTDTPAGANGHAMPRLTGIALVPSAGPCTIRSRRCRRVMVTAQPPERQLRRERRSASTRCPIPLVASRRREGDLGRGLERHAPARAHAAVRDLRVRQGPDAAAVPSGPSSRSPRRTGRPWAARRSAERWRSASATIPTARGYLLLYLPEDGGAGRRVPAFLGLNFEGNHAVSKDPGIALSTQWLRERSEGGSRRITARPRPRAARRRRGGRSSGSWPAAMPWRPPTTATSTRTTTTASRTASSPSSTGRARRGRPPTSGARSAPGPGA